MDVSAGWETRARLAVVCCEALRRCTCGERPSTWHLVRFSSAHCQPSTLHHLTAAQVYVRRVRKYLGAYFMHLGGQVDAIVFSAGQFVHLFCRWTPLPCIRLVPPALHAALSMGSSSSGRNGLLSCS